MTTTAEFIDTLGVNTHLDFKLSPDVATNIKALKHIGLPRVRDCPRKPDTMAKWLAVRAETGVKFHPYVNTGSVEDMRVSFSFFEDLYRNGLVHFIEGPNEEDVKYALDLGNSIDIAKAFHVSDVVPLAKRLNRRVINMSFGAGWTAANGWKGNYDKVGDMSSLCDFANAHTYPKWDPDPAHRQKTGATIRRLNGLAHIAAPNRPVFTTEIGWDQREGWTDDVKAKTVLQAAFGGFAAGNPFTYFYALFSNPSANNGAGSEFGLMNPDGTPRPAGTALHNLTRLFKPAATPGATLAKAHLQAPVTTQLVGLTGELGCSWYALWDETAPAKATLTFDESRRAQVYRPLVSTACASQSMSTGLEVEVTDEVKLIKVFAT